MSNNKQVEFICIGSGSSGNAYIFRKNNECILLECGFEFKKLTAKLLANGIKLSDIRCVIISHKHGDHSKAIADFVKLGFKCYVPESTFGENSQETTNVKYIRPNSKIDLTSWMSAYCFSVAHDVECYGFAFLDKDNNESILFITDTKLFDFALKNVEFNYIFIECNHIRKQLEVIMQKALDNGKQGEVFKFKRQAAYHLSLAACKKFLYDLNLKRTKAIFLLHLSKECCNDVVIKTEIKSVYGITTYVCGSNGGIN